MIISIANYLTFSNYRFLLLANSMLLISILIILEIFEDRLKIPDHEHHGGFSRISFLENIPVIKIINHTRLLVPSILILLTVMAFTVYYHFTLLSK